MPHVYLFKAQARGLLFAFAAQILLFALAGHVSAFNWAWDQYHDPVNVKDDDDDDDNNDGPCDECVPCEMCNVYTRTGGYFEKAVDIELPGVGPALLIRRTWNSTDPASTLLGNGWTFNLGRNIVPLHGNDGQEYAVVRRENGQEVKLLRTGSTYAFSTQVKYPFVLVKTSTGWLLTERDGKTNEYNNDGKLVATSDRLGQSITYNYASATGCLERARNASGNTLDFTLNPNGKLASIADNLGRSVTYTYDGNGNLNMIEYWDGSRVTYNYDSRNLMTEITNRRGQVIKQIVYDQNRRAIQVSERGETFTFSYDPQLRKGVKTDSKGRTWTTYADEFGINIQVIDPLGNTVNRKPAAVTGGRGMEWEEDANGYRTSYTWSQNGDMTSRTDPLGNSEFWIHNDDHQVTAFTNAAGTITRHVYDSYGNLTQKTEGSGNPGQRVWRYTYDSYGNMTSIINPLGSVTTYEYDLLGNVTRQERTLDEITTATYDSLGQVTTISDPLRNTWSCTYDGRGNRISETDGRGNRILREFDVDNNLVSVTDALEHRTVYQYDAWNRLTRKIGALQDTVLQQWTTIGDEDFVSGVRDPAGRWTYLEYDNAGRCVKQIKKVSDALPIPDVDDVVTGYTHDPAGNTVKLTKPDGDTIGYAYSANNDLAAKRFENGVRSYDYNGLGELIRISTGDSVLHVRQYDIYGNILMDSIPGKYKIRREFDPLNRVSSMTSSVGTTVYKYDISAGRLVRITTPQRKEFLFQHDHGQLRTMSYPNGITANYSFDANGNLLDLYYKRQDGSMVQRFQYGYDETNMRVSMIDNEGLHEYTYDALWQITKGTHPTMPNPLERFTYDEVGNRKTVNGAAFEWVHNELNQLLESDSFKYEYDADGNQILRVSKATGDSTRFEYDIENQLVHVTKRDTVVEYKYDAFGRRMAKIINGKATEFRYDGRNLILEVQKDTVGNDSICASYAFGPGIDQPLLMSRGGNNFYYHVDGLGSIRALTVDNADVVQEYQFTVYGRIIKQTTAIENPFTYTAREYDRETGNYYYRARYYDPYAGRFLSEDPAGLRLDDLNLFAYVRNSPAIYGDPQGAEMTRRIESAKADAGFDAARSINKKYRTDTTACAQIESLGLKSPRKEQDSLDTKVVNPNLNFFQILVNLFLK